MPKKTRKEKQLARYHNELRKLEIKQPSSPIVQPKITIKKINSPVIEEPVNNYFFSDLKKSLILIVLIVGVEVGLYFSKLIK